MLQSIRDKTSGWIAYLIVFLISVPFALWGVNSYLGGGEIAPAAVVNGNEISVSALDNAYVNYRRRLAQVFGGSIPEAFDNETRMKEQVLSQMIEEYALRSFAEDNHFRIGDQLLNTTIRSMEVFQTDGKFDAERYQSQIASLGYSTRGWEYELRQMRAMEQLQTGIANTAFSIPASTKKAFDLTNQTRKFRQITRILDIASYTIDETEISSYYDQNTARYMTDERVKIDYVELSLDQVKAAIDVTDEQVRDRYEQAADAYTSAEVRSASHILLTMSEDASDDESLEVESRINELRSELDSGANFATLAEANSQDPGSAADGGSLGEVELGMMVQPFETALFSLQPGEVSQPVKTSFGWHLIKLDGMSGGEIQTLDELRAEIADEIKTEIAESQIYDLTENMANLAYEQPDSLLPAVEELGLTLKTSDWFSRHAGEGIADDSAVRSAAFSSEVLQQKLNSGALELDSNRVVFIRLNEHQPAKPRGYEEVRDQIATELKRNKGREDNVAAGEMAIKSLAAGQSINDIAQSWNSEVIEIGPVKRDSTDTDVDVVKLAFTMSKPEGSPVFEGVVHGNGDYTIVELLSVDTDGDSISKEFNQTLISATANQEYQSILKLLASQADVIRTPVSELEN